MLMKPISLEHSAKLLLGHTCNTTWPVPLCCVLSLMHIICYSIASKLHPSSDESCGAQQYILIGIRLHCSPDIETLKPFAVHLQGSSATDKGSCYGFDAPDSSMVQGGASFIVCCIGVALGPMLNDELHHASCAGHSMMQRRAAIAVSCISICSTKQEQLCHAVERCSL